MENKVYLSLGSNIGNRVVFLHEAVKRLDSLKEVVVTNVSSIYETDPVGYEDQNNFLNMALEIQTNLKAEQLLHECMEIEKKLGRERLIRWGPRTVDIDILLYNQENINKDQITVPHPRLTERAFVLIPLMDMNPGLSVPGTGKTIQEIMKTLSDKGVRLWRKKTGEGEFGLFES